MTNICVLRVRFEEIKAARHWFSFTANRSVPAHFSTSTIMSRDLDIEKAFEFAKDLTLQAAKIFECDMEGEKIIYNKNEWDFVTNYDQKIEKIFIDGLSREFPDHKIIGEETVAATRKMPELTDAPTWFLDPIDGTINFMHSFPHFSITLALMDRKQLVFGITYNPVNSEMYSAIKDKGAFLNGKPIHVSKITELKKAMMGLDMTVLKHIRKDKEIFKARMDALTEATQSSRNIGSAALTMAYLARGAIDCIHIDYMLKPWDVAAGTLIIREAGGTLIDLKGDDYNIMKPDIIAAANETLAQEIRELIVNTDLKTQRKRI